MKKRHFSILFMCIGGILCASGVFGVRDSNAQQNGAYSQQNPALATQYFNQQRSSRKDPKRKFQQELARLVAVLKAAKDDDQRKQATEETQKLIADFFDVDMESRRKELDRLRERAEGTRDLLKRRKNAKDDLVDLQLKSFQYEATGLGLLSSSQLPQSQAPNAPGNHYIGSEAFYGARAQVKKADPLEKARRLWLDQCQKYRQAKSDEERSDLSPGLRDALAAYFDVDMNQRQSELDEIFAGLDKMSKGIDKRAQAKKDIVDLELKLVLNAANGLGFFRSDARRRSSVQTPDNGSGFYGGLVQPGSGVMPPAKGDLYKSRK